MVTAVGAGMALGQLPYWIGLCYLAGTVVSFLTYRADKRAAAEGRWRVPENTLHLIDVIFGVIGGLVAQGVLRHKTSKSGFAVTTAMIAAAHLAIIIAAIAGLLKIR